MKIIEENTIEYFYNRDNKSFIDCEFLEDLIQVLSDLDLIYTNIKIVQLYLYSQGWKIDKTYPNNPQIWSHLIKILHENEGYMLIPKDQLSFEKSMKDYYSRMAQLIQAISVIDNRPEKELIRFLKDYEQKIMD